MNASKISFLLFGIVSLNFSAVAQEIVPHEPGLLSPDQNVGAKPIPKVQVVRDVTATRGDVVNAYLQVPVESESVVDAGPSTASPATRLPIDQVMANPEAYPDFFEEARPGETGEFVTQASNGHKPRRLKDKVKAWFKRLGKGFTGTLVPLVLPAPPVTGGQQAATEEPAPKNAPDAAWKKLFSQFAQTLGRGLRQQEKVRKSVGTVLLSFEKKKSAPVHKSGSIESEKPQPKNPIQISIVQNFGQPKQAPPEAAPGAGTSGTVTLGAIPSAVTATVPTLAAAQFEPVAVKPISQTSFALPSENAEETIDSLALPGEFGELAAGEMDSEMLPESAAEAEEESGENAATISTTKKTAFLAGALPFADPALWGLILAGAVGWAATSPKRGKTNLATRHAAGAATPYEGGSHGKAAPQVARLAQKPRRRRFLRPRLDQLTVSSGVYRFTLGIAWGATVGLAGYVLALLLGKSNEAREENRE